MFYKKRMLVLLIMTMILLSACGKGQNNESVNKGRYVEEEIALPEGEEVIGLLQNKDGELELTTWKSNESTGEYHTYILQPDKSWKEEKREWLDQVSEIVAKKEKIDGIIEKVVRGQDGAYYALVKAYDTNSSRNFIFRTSDYKAADWIEIPFLSEISSNNSNYELYNWVTDVQVLSDGTLALNDAFNDNVKLFSQAGDLIGELKIKGLVDSMVGGNQYVAYGEQVLGFDKSGRKLLVLDGANQTEVRSYDMEEEKVGASLYQSEAGTLYIADKKGIHRLNSGGTLWETVVDGELCSLGMPTMSIRSFCVEEGERDVYDVLYNNEQNVKSLIRYTFDDTVVSVPSNELTVFSLRENLTIRQAIALFQKDHPDVKVNYTVAMGDEETNEKDYIKALNTELMGGGGADVLLLDGLPTDSYVEKGVLENLDSLCVNQGILSNIIQAFLTEQGIYQIPARITVPLVIGQPNAIEAAGSLSQIVAFEKQNEAVPYVRNSYFEEVAREFLKMEYYNMITKENKIDKEALRTYLENLRYLVDNGSLSADENNSFGFSSNAYFLKEKTARAYWDNVQSMDTLFMSQALCKNTDYQMAILCNGFYANGLMGINHASKQKELAGEFIQFVLNDSVQSIEVGDGLPVQQASWDKLVANKKDMYYGMSYSMEDGSIGYLEASYPAKKTRQNFANLVAKTTLCIPKENELMKIIMEESMEYLKNGENLDGSLASIVSKADTFLSEQGQ
ncbi:MAG: hypothetical protein PWP24_117 [Clostridiales bacterium]|nr:hypothetical protein [Clostridiales bacterium]